MGTIIVSVDDARFELADADTLPELRRHIEEAAQAGGRFVDLTAAGGRPVAIFITPHSRIIITYDTTVNPEPVNDVVPFAGLHLLEEI